MTARRMFQPKLTRRAADGVAAVDRPGASAPSPSMAGAPSHSDTVRLLRLPEVMTRTGRSRSRIYEAMALGTFPQAVSLGSRSVAWYEHEIRAWQLALPRRGTRVKRASA